jgi:ABC-type dipeptide/oligopeptide/nickel transport system ATPase component
MKNLKLKRKLTILFISHDMNVIKYLADRIGVMYYGEIIEENYAGTVFRLPKEEYTKTLLNAVPKLKI